MIAELPRYRESALLSAREKAAVRYAEVLADYRTLRDEIRGVGFDRLVPFDAARHPFVAKTYKRPIHLANVPMPTGLETED